MDSTEKDLFLQDLDNRKHKRNAVKEMEYSSSDDDSDNDNDDSDSDNNIKSKSKSDKKVSFDPDTKTGTDNNIDDDEDDDMFASDTEDKPEPTSTPTTTDSKKKKLKAINTLDMATFEQQLNDTNEDSIKLPELQSNPDIMDEDDDENGDDDEDEEDVVEYYNNQESSHLETENTVTKKKKRIRQPKMESFNLKKEMREGVFDESGNYIRNNNRSDSDSESDDDDDDSDDSKTLESGRDTWLQGINKEDIEKARLAEQKRQTDQKAKFIELKKQARSIDTADILGKLIVLMVPAETVLELLQRLNGDVKKLSKQLKKKRGTEGGEVGEEVKRVKLQIKDVTKFVGLLEDRGFKDVYEMSKEQFGRAFRRVTGKAFIEPSTAVDASTSQENQEDTGIGKKRKREDEDEENFLETEMENGFHTGTPVEVQDNGIMWEYKWSPDDEDEELYGPFDSATMEAWKESYFQENVAYARRVGDSNGEFVDVRELQFL
ncbi:unnamed protein product [Ambrosiozyma monospora]|uniref:Unnamed protein product n=1 Tax=Ambrosiozyma monospora TaxID=43982 RepID=A0ACB5SVR5_AMBMO|nr:unnamed protein product [Ambrosiozyma monospora]